MNEYYSIKLSRLLTFIVDATRMDYHNQKFVRLMSFYIQLVLRKKNTSDQPCMLSIEQNGDEYGVVGRDKFQ